MCFMDLVNGEQTDRAYLAAVLLHECIAYVRGIAGAEASPEDEDETRV